MIRVFFLTTSILLAVSSYYGQSKLHEYQPPLSPVQVNLKPLKDFRRFPVSTNSKIHEHRLFPKTLDYAKLKKAKIKRYKNSIWIEGGFMNHSVKRNKQNIHWNVLESAQKWIPVQSVREEFRVKKIEQDELGMNHHKLQQMYQGLEIYGGEVIIHSQDGNPIRVNGVVFPTPRELNLGKELVTAQKAMELAYDDLGLNREAGKSNVILQLLEVTDQAKKIIVYKNEKPHIAWHLDLHPNHLSDWQYFIDVQTGEILRKYNNVCRFHHYDLDDIKPSYTSDIPTSNPEPMDLPQQIQAFDGPAIGMGVDLKGVNQQIHCLEAGGQYALMDGSRAMFKSWGSESVKPQGIIWTLDTKREKPSQQGYRAYQVISNSSTFNNPTAVSAHTNSATAYLYALNTFNRNSINGSGGSIVSFINIVDENGSEIDNAFWGNETMMYGNGKQIAKDFALGLDVAGHEMFHGVIQNTAGLEYMNESGALNESFADIFGAMIDRDDWQMGEDIVLPGVFPNNALRDLSNPHNGGNSLNDLGYQPNHNNSKFNGTEDNGGVHINSGIHNFAFYKVATRIGSSEEDGKAKAEQIFYRALSVYLTRFSSFIDARNAAVSAAQDIHGANSPEVQIVNQAFDEVGIGAGAGTAPVEDVVENPGVDLILHLNTFNNRLSLTWPDRTEISDGLTNFVPLSRASLTDDGSALVYVSEDHIMRYILFDWSKETLEEAILEIGTISNEAIYRNVVISKQGDKIAALTAEEDNNIHIYDYNKEAWQTYPLYNPTTASGGFRTNNVLRADAMEFDFTGEYLMYDAENFIENVDGPDITTWDIGFLRIADLETGAWGDGAIFKLVSGLPDNVSIIGNPTFAKNSPFKIAFDLVETVDDPIWGPTEEYYVLGADLETGDFGSIVQGTKLGFPSYSPDDKWLMYDSKSEDLFGTAATLFAAPLNPDKINFADQGELINFKQYAYWSNWFATGTRELTSHVSTAELDEFQINLFPNPNSGQLNLQYELSKAELIRIQLYDLIGKKVLADHWNEQPGKSHRSIDLDIVPTGIYSLKINIGSRQGVYKIIVQ